MTHVRIPHFSLAVALIIVKAPLVYFTILKSVGSQPELLSIHNFSLIAVSVFEGFLTFTVGQAFRPSALICVPRVMVFVPSITLSVIV